MHEVSVGRERTNYAQSFIEYKHFSYKVHSVSAFFLICCLVFCFLHKMIIMQCESRFV